MNKNDLIQVAEALYKEKILTAKWIRHHLRMKLLRDGEKNGTLSGQI